MKRAVALWQHPLERQGRRIRARRSWLLASPPESASPWNQEVGPMSSISDPASRETVGSCTSHVRQPALQRRRPVRVALVTAAVVAGVLLLARASHAYEG